MQLEQLQDKLQPIVARAKSIAQQSWAAISSERATRIYKTVFEILAIILMGLIMMIWIILQGTVSGVVALIKNSNNPTVIKWYKRAVITHDVADRLYKEVAYVVYTIYRVITVAIPVALNPKIDTNQ